MEETPVPVDAASAFARHCDESGVCRVADGAVVSSGDFSAAAEHSSPVEVLRVPKVFRSDGEESHARKGHRQHHLQGEKGFVSEERVASVPGRLREITAEYPVEKDQHGEQ